MSRYVNADWLYNELGDINMDIYTDEVKEYIDSAPGIDLVRCAECRWSRPRTLKGETGYRCLFYRVDKAKDGYCDCGERE